MTGVRALAGCRGAGPGGSRGARVGPGRVGAGAGPGPRCWSSARRSRCCPPLPAPVPPPPAPARPGAAPAHPVGARHAAAAAGTRRSGRAPLCPRCAAAAPRPGPEVPGSLGVGGAGRARGRWGGGAGLGVTGVRGCGGVGAAGVRVCLGAAGLGACRGRWAPKRWAGGRAGGRVRVLVLSQGGEYASGDGGSTGRGPGCPLPRGSPGQHGEAGRAWGERPLSRSPMSPGLAPGSGGPCSPLSSVSGMGGYASGLLAPLTSPPAPRHQPCAACSWLAQPRAAWCLACWAQLRAARRPPSPPSQLSSSLPSHSRSPPSTGRCSGPSCAPSSWPSRQPWW